MAFAIFKVVDMAGGKVTAKFVSNPQSLPIELKYNDIISGNDLTRYYKFTFIKSSDFNIQIDESTTAEINFKYKDNF